MKTLTDLHIEVGHCLACEYQSEGAKVSSQVVGIIKPDPKLTTSWVNVPWPNGQLTMPAPFLRQSGDFLAFGKILATSQGLDIERFVSGENRTVLIFTKLT